MSELFSNIVDRLDVIGLERLKRFQFAVQIDGTDNLSKFTTGFESIDGLDYSVDVREVTEGGNKRPYKFARRVRHNEITFLRGMTFDRSLYNWHQEVINWKPGKSNYRRTISIYVLSQFVNHGNLVDFEAWRFDIYDAWPSQWNGPKLAANEEEFAFESIVVQHGGLVEKKGLFSGQVGTYLSILQ